MAYDCEGTRNAAAEGERPEIWPLGQGRGICLLRWMDLYGEGHVQRHRVREEGREERGMKMKGERVKERRGMDDGVEMDGWDGW